MIRLGLHRMSPDHDAAFQRYVEAVRPQIVKFLDPGPGDDPLAAWCQARGVEVVGRVYFKDQYLGAEGGRQMKKVLGMARACSHIRYWELHNEAWHVPGEMADYSDLTIEFMQALDAAGMGQKAVGGCFSEGTPQVDGSDGNKAWAEFAPAVQHIIDHGHRLGLHEYSAPTMSDLLDADGTGWHTMRYRKSLHVLQEVGVQRLEKLRIFITESGLDDIQDAHRRGPPGKGWRDYDGTPWAKQPLSEHGDFAGQMKWYCLELSKDQQIAGLVDFGWSARDDASWSSFDMAEVPAMQDRMIAEMRPGPNVPPPQPQPPEVHMITGCDVSKWQGQIDWPHLAATEIEFAMIRAGVGVGYVDPFWDGNARNAVAAGLLVSPYHYWLNGHDPEAQARMFQNLCRGRPIGRPACDFEETDNPTVDVGRVKAYLEAVTAVFGIRPFVYTSAGWWNRWVGLQSWAKDYPLWVAHWTTNPQPLLPKGWASWAIWQPGGGPGARYGVQSALLDLDRFAGTMEQLKVAMAIPAAQEPPSTGEPNLGKVVWFLEDAQRRCEAEGLLAESRFIGSTYTADAIKRRDS